MSVRPSKPLPRALCLALLLALSGGMATAQLPTVADGQPTPVGVQAAPASVSLNEYLQLLARNSARIKAERTRMAAARADTTTAGTWPNPTVSASRQRQEKDLGIQQPLPIFGQLSQRVKTARQAEDVAAAQLEASVQDALSEGATAFNEVLVAQRRLALWQAARDDLMGAARIVKGQIEAGARSQYDGARIVLQVAQMDVQIRKAEAALKDAASKMAALASLPRWEPVAIGSLKPMDLAAYASSEALWEQARSRLPALKAAAADLEQSRQQIALQQREAIPTPSLSYTRVNHRQDGRYGIVGVSVDIPLFDRKQGAIDKARADEMQAQYKQEAAEVAAQAELWRSLQQLRMANDALAAFESDALSQLDQLRRMAQDSYQLGKSNVLELIDVLDTLRERRMDHLDLVKDMLDAQWRLRVASGNMPQVQP
ncbi:TolC family protein [Comamonas sp. B21-038]|uniref:TolC family protein n=1 Tax=Comamonas sp. B21-038 TaxID=2918299 RepID=UPI001EFBAA93|nr:TolC family protein [Comamonas sp. B21-038]ULR89192.1 TolC family protein [Comamonas sp. B21-038]